LGSWMPPPTILRKTVRKKRNPPTGLGISLQRFEKKGGFQFTRRPTEEKKRSGKKGGRSSDQTGKQLEASGRLGRMSGGRINLGKIPDKEEVKEKLFYVRGEKQQGGPRQC